MKSSLKIDFTDTGSGLQPVIRVKCFHDLEDARDSLMQTFFQKLGGDSSWLKVEFEAEGNGTAGYHKYINIFPVEPSQLSSMVIAAFDRLRHSDQPQVLKALMAVCELPQDGRIDGPWMPDVNLIASAGSPVIKGNLIGVRFVGVEDVVHPNDLIMDSVTRVIGQAVSASKDMIWMKPFNLIAWDSARHFQGGRTFWVIQRTFTVPFSEVAADFMVEDNTVEAAVGRLPYN